MAGNLGRRELGAGVKIGRLPLVEDERVGARSYLARLIRRQGDLRVAAFGLDNGSVAHPNAREAIAGLVGKPERP
jgi:hypothetical protein